MFDKLASNPTMIAAVCGFLGLLVGWAVAVSTRPRAPSQDEREDLNWLRMALDETDARNEALHKKILALETELNERRGSTQAPFSLRTAPQPSDVPPEQLPN